MSYFDTDKIEPHGYFQTYVKLAAKLGPAARVIELGVDKGESLRMWQSLFPLGEITGVDIDRHAVWPKGTVKIVADHADPELPGMLSGEYDLVVDDGPHHAKVAQAAWFNIWKMVRPGGYYVFEDWQVSLRADEHWGGCYGPSMLKLAEGFLTALDSRDAEMDEIIYRYGLIILHKNRSSE